MAGLQMWRINLAMAIIVLLFLLVSAVSATKTLKTNMPFSPRAVDYEMIPYSVDVPNGGGNRWAWCSRGRRVNDPPLKSLMRDTDWQDVTSTVANLLDPTKKPPNWCLHTSGPRCLADAISQAGTPVSGLRMIACTTMSVFQPFLDQFRGPGALPWPESLIVYGHMHNFESGDKTGLFVKLLPSLPEPQRSRAYEYAPRAYLVPVDCAGPRIDDQWNLWLADYYDGDESRMAQYEREGRGEFRVTDDDRWMQKQAIDMVGNSWVAKAGMGASFNASSSAGKQILKSAIYVLHMGANIELIASPDEFISKMAEQHRESGSCSPEYRVLQKAVERPALWGGYKADLRLFIATTSVDPPVHYLYLGFMPVRIARYPYSAISGGPRGAFVTNQHLATEEENVDVTGHWLDYFDYLQSEHPHIHDLTGLLIDRLMDLGRAITPAIQEMKHPQPGYAIQAWDVILDEDLQPWLMEANNFFHMGGTQIEDCIYPLIGSGLSLGLRSDVRGKGCNPPAKIQDWHLL